MDDKYLNNGLDDINNRLFNTLLKYGIPVALIALLPGVIVSLIDNKINIAITDLISFLLLILIRFVKSIPRQLKKVGTLSVFSVLAIFLINELGFFGPGVFYLFATTVICALILPIRNAYFSIILNILILIIFSVLLKFNLASTHLIERNTLSQWIAFSSNLVFLSIVIVVLINLIFDGLKNSIDAERLLSNNYKNLFDLSPVPMWLFDVCTLKFLNVNQAAINKYGYTLDEFLKLNITDIRAPEHEQEVKKIVNQNSISGSYYTTVVNHKVKSGKIIHVQVESNLVEYNGIKARLILANDISNQIIAKNQILEINRKLKSAQRIGKIGYWELDYTTKQIIWSDEVYELFKYHPQSFQLTFESFITLLFEEDQERFISTLISSAPSLKCDIEYRIRCADNTIKHVYQFAEFIYNEENKLIRVDGIIQDITEAKNKERSIRESELNLRAIYESAVDGVILLNSDFHIKSHNTMAQEMLKFNDIYFTQLVGKNILEFVEPYRQAELKNIFESVKSGQIVEYDRCFSTLDTNDLWIHYSLTPVYENNSVVGITITMRNITASKLYLQKIEEQNKLLYDISWAQSHLVRAPLSRIMALVDLLTDNQDEKDKAYLLSYLSQSTEELDEVVKKISNLQSNVQSNNPRG